MEGIFEARILSLHFVTCDTKLSLKHWVNICRPYHYPLNISILIKELTYKPSTRTRWKLENKLYIVMHSKFVGLCKLMSQEVKTPLEPHDKYSCY